jgi:hypothetical protein
MGLHKATRNIINAGVRDRTPFRRGNVSGTVGTPHYDAGWLALPYLTVWQDQVRREAIEYVLWSYDTPMAWKTRDLSKWIFPADKYSVTTSGHQGAFHMALYMAEHSEVYASIHL